MRLSIEKIVHNLPKNKIQTQACISKKTQGHVASIVFLSTCFAVGLFLSWLWRSLNFRTSPKDSAAQSKTNGKVTWTLPLCNAVEEPLGWAALQEPTPDTSGTLSPIGQMGETFFVYKRKGKKEFQPWPRLTTTPPLGSSRWGSSCLCCKKTQHLQVRGWASTEQEQRWASLPARNFLYSEKYTKSCSLLLLLPYLVILVKMKYKNKRKQILSNI